ncbi:hypothetical protein [Pusillimonas sp. ANT_WB101]|uniref:hypothetical protein n=1 Tax=Pusillimonas sp. ANT_WB101 TaxID=2597356 RepID=UPI00210304B8|nr:hypothetical protein [Pusillimonas sp. ANT_WB101]
MRNPLSTKEWVKRLIVGLGKPTRSARSAFVSADPPCLKARKMASPRSSDRLPGVTLVNGHPVTAKGVLPQIMGLLVNLSMCLPSA